MNTWKHMASSDQYSENEKVSLKETEGWVLGGMLHVGRRQQCGITAEPGGCVSVLLDDTLGSDFLSVPLLHSVGTALHPITGVQTSLERPYNTLKLLFCSYVHDVLKGASTLA